MRENYNISKYKYLILSKLNINEDTIEKEKKTLVIKKKNLNIFLHEIRVFL